MRKGGSKIITSQFNRGRGMARKYSLLKRVVQAVPGLRGGLAAAFMLLPKPLSAKAYAFLRRRVFPDNQPRVAAFDHAFKQVRQSTSDTVIQYYEFGVARGTSVISSYQIAKANGLDLKIFAFDSFKGLPSSEGIFAAGDMAYPDATFRRFVDKAGVPLEQVTSIPGFFNVSLTDSLKLTLGLKPSVAVFHNDSDLYESTRDALSWIEDLAMPGSVIIFDDWYSFSSLDKPEHFGEKRAFAEWPDRPNWKLLFETSNANIAFVKTE